METEVLWLGKTIKARGQSLGHPFLELMIFLIILCLQQDGIE